MQLPVVSGGYIGSIAVRTINSFGVNTQKRLPVHTDSPLAIMLKESK